jgi:hypothetical protein
MHLFDDAQPVSAKKSGAVRAWKSVGEPCVCLLTKLIGHLKFPPYSYPSQNFPLAYILYSGNRNGSTISSSLLSPVVESAIHYCQIQSHPDLFNCCYQWCLKHDSRSQDTNSNKPIHVHMLVKSSIPHLKLVKVQLKPPRKVQENNHTSNFDHWYWFVCQEWNIIKLGKQV